MLAVSPALTLLLPRSSSSPIHFCGRLAFPQPSSSSCVQGLAPPPSCRRAQSTFGFPKRAERLYRPCATSEHHDPGHWNFSPEWWGTQGGGWGHDAGKVVFMQHSHCGNGEVTVTAHHASGQGVQSHVEHQWRVLRFNETRQSVSRVAVRSGAADAVAGCLAFEYLKTMAAVAAAIVRLSGKLDTCLDDAQSSQQQLQQSPTCHALCLGLGAGSLPLFLSHHFPGMLVQAVELDPVVIAAATQEMGLPAKRANLKLHQAEAGDFLMKLATDVTKGIHPPLDLLLVDVFNGKDNVPQQLCSAGSPVLEAMAAVLHPTHGTVIMNLHGGGVLPHNALVALFKKLLPGRESSGYMPSTEQGRSVQEVTAVLRSVVLHSQPPAQGNALTLKVAYQSNIIAVVSRALAADKNAVKSQLSASGQRAAEQADYVFNGGVRCVSGLTPI